MRTLIFLVIRKNKEILVTLKKLIKSNEVWNAEVALDGDTRNKYR